MPSAYLQWQFHSGERDVARGPLVFFDAVVLIRSELLLIGLKHPDC